MKNLAIGTQSFELLRNGRAFYLDKTKQIYNLLNCEVRHYFFSRPRRFGKSLMLSTIKHLFLGDKELFKDLYIADKWDFTETNPVLHISFSAYSENKDLTKFMQTYGTVSYTKNGQLIEKKLSEYPEFGLFYILEDMYQITGKATVIIIDEYDKPVLAHLQNVEKAEAVRQFFADFYGPVKDNDKYIRLFLLTGLTKLMKMSVFSVLNNLDDITFKGHYQDLIGYTQQELEDNFAPEIKEIANKRGESYEYVMDKVKKEYNGFNFGSNNLTLYNPWDINSFIDKQEFGYYWSDTGIPSAIKNYVQNNMVDVQAMINAVKENRLIVDELDLRVQDLSKIKAEILFLNSGYLTIKQIIDDNFYLLSFPNRETEQVMLRYFLDLATDNSLDLFAWKKTSDQIVKAIFAKNSTELETSIYTLIYEVLSHVSYEWVNKNPEGWLKTLLGVAIRMNSVYYWAEPQNLLGRADFHIPKDGNIFVVEVKVNESTKKAIEQIDDKYTAQYQQEYVQVVKVGVNWNKKKKKVEVVINPSSTNFLSQWLYIAFK